MSNPFTDPPTRGNQWTKRTDLTGFRSEGDLADAALERLEKWFTVQREVWGRHCTGRRMRIDAVLRPRDPENWASGTDARIGLEFKYPAALYDPGIKNYTKWAAQTVDYGHVNWDGYGRMYVFTCPGAVEWLTRGYADQSPEGRGWAALVVPRLLGQLGIGELIYYTGPQGQAPGLTLMLQDHRMWSERGGVAGGKKWRLAEPRTGSR